MLEFDMVLKAGRSAAIGCRPPDAGGLACHPGRRGNDVPHFGAVACYRRAGRAVFTRRARSSPHLACGLNGSFFLHTCNPLNTALAGGRFPISELGNTCGTLHRGGILWEGLGGSLVEGEGGSLKKSNFSNLPTETVWRPRIPWVKRLQKGVTEK